MVANIPMYLATDGLTTATGIELIANTAELGTVTGEATVTSAINTTGASIIILFIAWSGSTPVVVTDSAGNTWTELSTWGSYGNLRVKLYYCLNPTTSTNHTFSVQQDDSKVGVAVSAFSGVDSFDSEVGENTPSTYSTSPGPITPSQENSLIITGIDIGYDYLTNFQIDSDFIPTDILIRYSGSGYGVAFAYKVQETAASEEPTWSWSSGYQYVTGVIAVFAPPA